MEAIIKQLEDAGYDYAVAIATKAEIEAGAGMWTTELDISKSVN